MDLSVSSNQVVITHNYLWETTHVSISGSVNYGYEQVNETEAVGMVFNGTALGSVKLSTYHKAAGLRLGNVTGHVEVLLEAANSSLTMAVRGHGVSRLYSGLGYVDVDEGSLFTVGWIGPFTVNATVHLITPIRVGAAPLEPCPKAPV